MQNYGSPRGQRYNSNRGTSPDIAVTWRTSKVRAVGSIPKQTEKLQLLTMP